MSRDRSRSFQTLDSENKNVFRHSARSAINDSFKNRTFKYFLVRLVYPFSLSIAAQRCLSFLSLFQSTNQINTLITHLSHLGFRQCCRSASCGYYLSEPLLLYSLYVGGGVHRELRPESCSILSPSSLSQKHAATTHHANLEKKSISSRT